MTEVEKAAGDEEILKTWRDAPAPLLPLLHAFQERDGHLSPEVLEKIGRTLRIPAAELHGTVSFYHHLFLEAPGNRRPRVCDGPICRLHGSTALLSELADRGARPMACAGRCDQPIPVLAGGRLLIGACAEDLAERPSPLPPPPAEHLEECVFRHIRSPGRATLEGYRRTGGYEALLAAARRGRPLEIIAAVEASGLAGRGGAGFPTARKWSAVREAPGDPKTVVCNADEGEPGCFKDRALLDHDPHAVIEGMVLCALATGATRGFIYLRYEYPQTLEILRRALREAEEAGLIGEDAAGSGREVRIHLRRGAGAYICGEETSLLNSLEGRHPFPRNRPPYPVTNGFEDLPTVVNNVETLAAVPQILRKGPDWYAGLGRGAERGTKVISLSGDISRPGNYEVPLGLPLREVLEDLAGGPPPGRSIQAVTMAGLSGGFLGAGDLDVTLDETSLRSRGSFLGAGGIMVFDDTRDMVDVAHQAMSFFASESCGKCFPCRIGTWRLKERLGGEAGPPSREEWEAEVREVGQVMKAASACGLGTAAPLVSDSLLRLFPEGIAARFDGSGRE